MIKHTSTIVTIAFFTFVAISVLTAICGCKFALKDASAAIGELMCETPKN